MFSAILITITCLTVIFVIAGIKSIKILALQVLEQKSKNDKVKLDSTINSMLNKLGTSESEKYLLDRILFLEEQFVQQTTNIEELKNKLEIQIKEIGELLKVELKSKFEHQIKEIHGLKNQLKNKSEQQIKEIHETKTELKNKFEQQIKETREIRSILNKIIKEESPHSVVFQ